MFLSSISQKGQVTIPSAVRKMLKLHTGDQVEFFVQDNQLFLKRHTQSVEELFGMFKVAHPVSDETIQKAIAKGLQLCGGV